MDQNIPSNQPPAAPPPGMPPAPPAPLSPSEERTWAMVAHLSVLLNLITGFLGIVAAIVVYLVFKDRSRYVAYQAMQAFVFQLIGWGAAWLLVGILWTITGILTPFLIGLLCIPLPLLAMLIPLAALVYGVYGGIVANEGKDFRYWLLGDWLRARMPA